MDMDKLEVQLENCFGIGSLNKGFDFTVSNTFLIYAPNGTMKTSFARTFDLISKKDKKGLCDRIYKDRKTECSVNSDGVEINSERILVINAEDGRFDASGKISTFLASKDLKGRYDSIYTGLDGIKSEFIKRLKDVSQSSDCETELTNTFSDDGRKSFFELLLEISKDLKDNPDTFNFKYNDVFDKKGNVKKFLDDNQALLDQYVENYKALINKSKFFKQLGDSSFGTYQAGVLVRATEDNSFFRAGHKFVLEDGTEVNDSVRLSEMVTEEISNALNDPGLKASFDKVDKKIGNNAELRSFKAILETDNTILLHLADYEKFRRDIWVSYLSQLKDQVELVCNDFAGKKSELEQIVKEARQEFKLWTDIVETFNSRFYVPFKVIIANQDDVILKQETANLQFDYSDRNSPPVKQDRDSLLQVLSKGEQRAFFILQFLFEIESRKRASERSLLILDDVADSFDYKNKYAIIEYIKEIHSGSNFRTIILTHNFDFYRTVASRLSLNRATAVLMATSSEVKEIKFNRGQYVNDLFDFLIDNVAKPKFFISVIPFVRNLVLYSDSDKDSDYLTLTECLHRKSNTDKLSANQVFSVFQSRLVKRLHDKTIGFGKKKIVDLIYNEANNIAMSSNVDEVAIENKIVLAIAIRLLAEAYMVRKLPRLRTMPINMPQTQAWFQEYRNTFPTSNSVRTLDKVNLMTPENLHVNSFMYEPLVDMSVHHLIQLYKEVKGLT